MPLPKVNPKEGEKEYVARCMKERSDKTDLKDEGERKQSLAMCFRKFRDDRGIPENAPKSMYQILKENE
jgi:hypothetical protein